MVHLPGRGKRHERRAAAAVMMICSALASCAAARQGPPPPQVEHVIGGVVLDSSGAPVTDAVIFICDRATGMQIDAHTKKPVPWLRKDRESESRAKWWTTSTDAEGIFEFKGVNEGVYRLVAQSWPDARAVEDPMQVNGGTVLLRGVVEDIQVPGDEAHAIEITPMGTANFFYFRGMPNNELFIVLSTGRPVADAVLGPLGMRGPFMEKAIVFGRMPKGRMVIKGLPETKITFMLFAADSSPGFAFGDFQGLADELASSNLNLVAGWSDARHDPPARLAELCDELRELTNGRDFARTLMIKGREKEWEARSTDGVMFDEMFIAADVLGPLDREIVLPSGTIATVADLMAAEAYLRLQAMHDE